MLRREEVEETLQFMHHEVLVGVFKRVSVAAEQNAFCQTQGESVSFRSFAKWDKRNIPMPPCFNAVNQSSTAKCTNTIRTASSSSLVRGSNARRRTLEIDSLDSRADFSALSGQVAEEFSRDLALVLHFGGFLALFLQVFHVALQAFAQLVGGVLERAANFGRNTCGVGVSVVDCGELCGEFR